MLFTVPSTCRFKENKTQGSGLINLYTVSLSADETWRVEEYRPIEVGVTV
jgi:hypothetical protein